MSSHKPVHTIILDAGPILKNDPSISTLLAKSEQLWTVSSVISEIKDIEARSRVETTLLPFLTIRNPGLESIKAVTDFARKTGDLVVLSKPDIAVLALAYELECEKNGGDWRLRRTPGQKGINGPVPSKPDNSSNEDVAKEIFESSDSTTSDNIIDNTAKQQTAISPILDSYTAPSHESEQDNKSASPLHTAQTLDASRISSDDQEDQSKEDADGDADDSDHDSSGSEGWITPSNFKKKQAKDIDSSSVALAENKIMQVATITTDFAMQNVLLQMGLNLLSPRILQVRNIKTYVLRCHACFERTKDMSKQFCPRCGKPTLTRISCSTNAKGEFQIHLKKNMQWNHRGDRFSIPKPVSGVANGKAGRGKGGGKGGWGQDLILAEDQKEYVRAMSGESRRKEKTLVDEDYLPSILTGDRGRAGGRPKCLNIPFLQRRSSEIIEVPRIFIIRRETGWMRTFGDFARLDLVQGVYPLPISINGVHEMHAVRRNVSDLIERIGKGTYIGEHSCDWKMALKFNWSLQERNSSEVEVVWMADYVSGAQTCFPTQSRGGNRILFVIILQCDYRQLSYSVQVKAHGKSNVGNLYFMYIQCLA
ncbi:MAG: hypothetical protein Q9195_004107 [Heterodermia aff. obscurata]